MVGDVQTINAEDNAAQVPEGVDAEWFAVAKEHALAEKCKVPLPAATSTTPSFFFTVMSQNGNAPSALGALATTCIQSTFAPSAHCHYHPDLTDHTKRITLNGSHYLGSDAACLPECFHRADATRPKGWPPAVNASSDIECPKGRVNSEGTNGDDKDRSWMPLIGHAGKRGSKGAFPLCHTRTHSSHSHSRTHSSHSHYKRLVVIRVSCFSMPPPPFPPTRALKMAMAC
jgi:hypothetical protein